MSKPEPQMICLTDHFLVLSLCERLDRGSPLALEEVEYLQRVLDRIELDSLQEDGFPKDWL
jgi:ribosome assembly protein YihI (activator of Der GTPase)